MPTNLTTTFGQTFFIDATVTPDGIFVAAIDLCFRSRDNVFPISLSLTSTSNGYPDISKYYNGSKVLKMPKDVNVSTGIGTNIPSFTDTSKYTRFVFPDPIYLPPGEHAILLDSNSVNYEVFVAKLNELIIGTDRRVSKQPYSGSLFKSQNGSTWTPIQEEDLMFRLIRAKFKNSSPAKIYFKDFPIDRPSSNRAYDAISFQTNDINFGKTKTTYGYKALTLRTASLDTAFNDIQLNSLNIPADRKEYSNLGDSIILETTMTSTSNYISPIVDLTRVNATIVTNIINDASLRTDLIAIGNPGAGYVTEPTITISAPTRPGGTQATANANIAGGKLNAIYILEQGSGYTETPTITISEITGAGTVNANATITGETSQIGGNARARYITRRVTLREGFDARDLQVILTANKLQNHDIQVYYKVLSAEDPDQNFDNKYWNRMRLNTNITTYSQTNLDLIEYAYVPAGAQAIPPTNITYTSDGVTFDTFRYFAIKICLFSNTTLNTPIVKNLRAIAIE